MQGRLSMNALGVLQGWQGDLCGPRCMQVSLKHVDIVWLFLLNWAFVQHVISVFTFCIRVPWVLPNYLPPTNRVWWFFNIVLEDMHVAALSMGRDICDAPSSALPCDIHPGASGHCAKRQSAA